MKAKLLLILSALFALTTYAAAENSQVSDLSINRDNNKLNVSMTINAGDMGKKSNLESLITPVLTQLTADSTAHTLRLPSILVAGRTRYYQALRHNVTTPMYRGGDIPYTATVDWEPWMESAVLTLERADAGCCNAPKGSFVTDLDTLDYMERVFNAQFTYIRPEAESVKTRVLDGKAFIDFPVNRTEIYPDYRSNPRELGVIRATIDSVRLDPDVTVETITFKGFASPEGPYNNNVRLAKGRTESLKNYVLGLYHFDPSKILTSYEPEDWEGLRRFMLTSGLENKQLILDIIDSNLEPDAKDHKLRRDFPTQYAFLLREVYPALRHTDYTINYIIRSYSDPAEILKLVYSRPQNLSANEFYLAAQAVEQGSPEWNYIFETAARMFPDDEVANLNAANAAIQSGAFENAEKYLAKAGDSADAIYTRALLAAQQKDYEKALPLFRQAARLKVAPAVDAISQITEILKHNNRIGQK